MNDCSTNYFFQIDSHKQIFRFSAPVFKGFTSLPESVARLLSTCVSEQTKLSLEKNRVVTFTEEIPCSWGPQPSLRQQFYRFVRRTRQCRHLFSRLAHIEHRHNADTLL